MNRLLSAAIGLMLFQQSHADIGAESMALNCRNCHDQNAAVTAVPVLNDMPVQQLRQKLLDFKYDKTAATLMPRIAKAYSDAELIAVAGYLGKR